MSSKNADLQHSAVVVIDMANDFVYPGGVIADAGGPEYQRSAQRIIGPLGRLLAAARRAGVTVVYATDAHTPTDSELKKWPPHAMVGTWNAEIVPGLAPEPGDIVLGKQTYSPFMNPAFARALESRGVTRLYHRPAHRLLRAPYLGRRVPARLRPRVGDGRTPGVYGGGASNRARVLQDVVCDRSGAPAADDRRGGDGVGDDPPAGGGIARTSC